MNPLFRRSLEVECPYCGAPQDIDRDSSSWSEEDIAHQQTCPHCDKDFVFHTMVSFSFTVKRADCLNGLPHLEELTNTYPRKFSRWRCKDCENYRKATPEEIIARFGKLE